MRKRKTILLDLDGVLNKYDGDYRADYIPPVLEGAREFVANLSRKYDLKLFTTRNKMIASIWLLENDLNDYFTGVTNEKEPAWLIIDDRGITFKGCYKKLLEDIESFTVWYKKNNML